MRIFNCSYIFIAKAHYKFEKHQRYVKFSPMYWVLPHVFGYLVTENTRAAYPIEFIPNAKMPCVGPHPKNVILLACDAFGVLPPVSKLSLAQTMYHFISGYTALVNIHSKLP